ncbi:MAG TPA: hypothetical protein DCK99_08825 [Blastocatellia bacterium]|nr:hypothetical protein [Blastocatellia bacterium]
MLRKAIGAVVILVLAIICVAQTPSAPSSPLSPLSPSSSSPPADPRGVIRLRVRVRADESTKGLSRKRFFLIKGSPEQNKSVIQAIEQQPVLARDCYYQRAGASEALIKWLKEGDCESVYCREVQPADIEGSDAVPEFLKALAAGEKEFGSRQFALKWLTVNLPENLRDGFYKNRQSELGALIKQAEAASGAKVLSVMTDRNGTAYFTDLEPGTYTLSNILATEIGSAGANWNCEVKVKPGDLATEKPFLISNRANKDKNVKCFAMEKPLPVCVPAPK